MEGPRNKGDILQFRGFGFHFYACAKGDLSYACKGLRGTKRLIVSLAFTIGVDSEEG